MCARALNSAGGGNTRSSRSVESRSWFWITTTGMEDIKRVLWQRELHARLVVSYGALEEYRVGHTLSIQGHAGQVGSPHHWPPLCMPPAIGLISLAAGRCCR